MATTTSNLNKLPAPPKDQKGITLEQFKHLPPPPQGQKGLRPDEITSKPKKSFLQKASDVVGSVFPGKKVGESIGTLAGAGLAKLKGTYGQYDISSPSPKQVAGDIASGALSVAGAKGLGTGGGLLARTGKQALIGAGASGAGALAEGGDVKKAATVGGIVGGALPGAGKALGSIADTLTIKTPRQLVNFAVKTPAKKVDKEISEYFLENKLGGKSLAKITEFAKQDVDRLENEIQESFTNKVIANVDDFVESVSKNYKSTTGATLDTSKVKARLAKFIPDHAELLTKLRWTDKEANIVRRAIDSNLKEATFQGKELTNEQKAVKLFADKLRGLVQKSTGTEELFKRQSKAITLRDVAEQAVNKEEVQGRPGLMDVAAVGVGGAFGGIPGSATAVLLQRAIRSPRIQGKVAQLLRSNKEVIPVLRKLSQPEKVLILNLLGRSIEDESSPQEGNPQP